MITLTALQTKEIVSIETGKRIGHIIDLEIDVDQGKITDIIIGARSGISQLFNKQSEYTIPWSNIVTFGDDVILIK
ncbi:YlmC/YmxH family sporulation protein [Amphibacillus sediminis]|uniref:YlmC/YmxH family sporulation protein n=1 Tax=Amphibacillus sediminis TaxID=360185 RepID=UPI00082BD108|nr:YlmC/YmxH family sporulation protein [Amphibacillus sediminis]